MLLWAWMWAAVGWEKAGGWAVRCDRDDRQIIKGPPRPAARSSPTAGDGRVDCTVSGQSSNGVRRRTVR